MELSLMGIITVADGNVHLDTSFNPDAMCCQEDENVIQRESYVDHGWNEPQSNPRLASDFWTVWAEWNGKMIGGIYLDDEYTYEKAYALSESLKHITPDEIANVKDGTYAVDAPAPF